MDHKDQMPYTEAVLHENLRLGCITPLSLPHGLTKEVRHGESIIPKEAVLIPNISSVLFDSRIFENPNSFCPDRFLDENGQLNGIEKYVTCIYYIYIKEYLVHKEYYLNTNINVGI